MTDKLQNGDYVKDEERGGLVTVEYIDALLQNAALTLSAPRGRFYPNKDFGSLIRNSAAEPRAAYAAAYARQALDGMDGVFVKSAETDGDTILLHLTINGEERQVSIKLDENI